MKLKYSLSVLLVLLLIEDGLRGKVFSDNYKKIRSPELFKIIEALKSDYSFGASRPIDVDINTAEHQKLVPSDEFQQIHQEDTTKPTENYFTWDRYHTYDNIQRFMDRIIEEHKDVVTPFVIGKTYEGRDICGIKISYKEGNPGIFIESNIHAREWITSATSTFLINELLNSVNSQVRNIAVNVDWYIIPVVNVDGFIYSHEKDRMWRKTRKPTENPDCPGTDPNRNFNTNWNNDEGSSDNPCDEDYRGELPFSEPECKALADFLESIKDTIGVYLAYHSFGQYILTPLGYNNTEFPENYADMMAVAKASHKAILNQGYGTKYQYGTMAGVYYFASGTSVDYAYNKLGIKMGLTFEFRDEGKFGFHLPSVYILPNCRETIAAMIALVGESKRLGYL